MTAVRTDAHHHDRDPAEPGDDPTAPLVLPPVPDHLASARVAAWREPVRMTTYLPEAPDRYPAYLDNRVYQGSSGRVFPLPFHDRISSEGAPRDWDAVHLQNEWVRLMVLPELGGRVHVGLDLSNGYDFFYRNDVIKPALVGLAGPWISGGVEFNWPQHHRPATFLPVDTAIEHEPDGAVTVWCSDHDPFTRMKGMHGLRLRPGSSVVELRVRLFNRSDETQTFLWWANAGVRVGDGYQSFFPEDVHFVADHARRAVTAFPRADRPYYGVDYPALAAERDGADRIDRYRNLPVPTSYMCVGSREDFFGGYDHDLGAGFVHWADHRIAPGKKQWTWGAADFGTAWVDNLTDANGPYIELMAGVYTDNQPDFSHLAPGETKTFSQFWYPLRGTGPVHAATVHAAARLDTAPLRVAVAVTSHRAGLLLELTAADGTVVWSRTADADPGSPVVVEPRGAPTGPLTLVVSHGGRELLRLRRAERPDDPVPPTTATEPPPPAELRSVEELHLTAVHLEQYRHATRSPEPYWAEALRRDPGHSASRIALARRCIRAARYEDAESHLRRALDRLTSRNANPADGEASYQLGRVLERLGRTEDAYDSYAKAAWNAAWRVPSWSAMARIDAARGADARALSLALDVLGLDSGQLTARCCAAVVLRRQGRHGEADDLLARTLALDPLHAWTRELVGDPVHPDGPTCVDVALEHASVGELEAALRVLAVAAAAPTALGQVAVAPLAEYHRADLLARAGRGREAAEALAAARAADVTWCLPSRLDDVDMLRRTCDAEPDDARAWALLGHWLYAQERRTDAEDAWRRAAALDPSDPVVRRNLGLAAHNVHGRPDDARAWYAQAREVAPDDARLLFEADQLERRTGAPVDARLAALLARRDLVARRDDLTVELAGLLTAAERPDEALDLLRGRRFQPWEGGEGQVLSAWEEAQLAVGRRALDAGNPVAAADAARRALVPPRSLGEARHPLAAAPHLQLLLGDALAAGGDGAGARAAWGSAAASTGDFRDMAAVTCSDLTFYSVVARRRLSDVGGAEEVLAELVAFTNRSSSTPARVDHFATSLPALLLFTDDASARREAEVLLLRAQVAALSGKPGAASDLLREVLRRDAVQPRARDLDRILRTPARPVSAGGGSRVTRPGPRAEVRDGLDGAGER